MIKEMYNLVHVFFFDCVTFVTYVTCLCSGLTLMQVRINVFGLLYIHEQQIFFCKRTITSPLNLVELLEAFFKMVALTYSYHLTLVC